MTDTIRRNNRINTIMDEYKLVKISISIAFVLAVYVLFCVNAVAANSNTDYSAVFDAKYYANKYPDLAVSGIKTDAELLSHFINNGMKEGREGSSEFNVHEYMSMYPDLKSAYGNDYTKYYMHYINTGKAEGRKGRMGSANPINNPKSEVRNNAGPDISYSAAGRIIKTYHPGQSIIIEGKECAKITSKTAFDFVIMDDRDVAPFHNYYNYKKCKLTDEQIIEAEDILGKFVLVVLNPDGQFKDFTDYERIQVLAWIVCKKCNKECKYGKDPNGYYATPYGVFVSGNYTCAGSTRALGRMLDYLGIKWAHVNEGEDCHQWCVFYLNGELYYADGMDGSVGKGNGLCMRKNAFGTNSMPLADHANYSFK